jgi:uncharacterized FlaG/YvyC family protein
LGFRINKVLTQYPSRTANVVAKKARDNSNSHSGGHQSEQGQDSEDNQNKVSIEELVEAVAQEAKELELAGNELHIELADPTKGFQGRRIRIRDSDGHTIREMSAEEFMNLRKKSHSDAHIRGRILDQKL